jgi:hypothetical protein
MAKDRNDRQATAGEFAAELRHALIGKSEAPLVSRADAATVSEKSQETGSAGRGATPQHLPAVTVDENSPSVVAHSAAAASLQPAASQGVTPTRSWSLGLMSSRGCQVTLTVAAMVVLGVMIGGYAMFQRFGASSPNLDTRSANTAAPPPRSTTNSNVNATENAFMSYYLLLSSSALDGKQRVLGNKPVPMDSSLQFAFNVREDGVLYLLGEDGQGNPVVMPLGTLQASAEVKAGQASLLPSLARIRLNSKPGIENFTVIYSAEAIDLPFASELLPIDGTFRKLTQDEQRKISELRQQSASSTVSFTGGDDNGTALVKLYGNRGTGTVVFDIKLQLKRNVPSR